MNETVSAPATALFAHCTPTRFERSMTCVGTHSNGKRSPEPDAGSVLLGRVSDASLLAKATELQRSLEFCAADVWKCR